MPYCNCVACVMPICGHCMSPIMKEDIRALLKDERCVHHHLRFCRWAVLVEPSNIKLQQRAQLVKELRKAGQPTIPTSLSLEVQTNPFLRPDSIAIRTTLHVPATASDAESFAVIRKHKDSF
jgi:hydroxyacylglutathione hydrolase